MKENEKLTIVLNQILVDELEVFNQNIFHPKVIDNLDCGELYEEIEREMAEELKNAEWLVKRIVFLEVWRTRQTSISTRQNNSKDRYEKRRKVG